MLRLPTGLIHRDTFRPGGGGLRVLLVAVALAGCLAGGSEQRADERPRVTAFACVLDRVSDRAFGIRSRQDSSAKLAEHRWVAFVRRRWFVVLETLGELLSVVKDVLDGAWHAHHLRNFSRAVIAWTTTDAVTPKIRRAVVRADGRMIVGLPKSDAGIRDVAIPPHLLPPVKGHLQDFTSAGKDALLFPAADNSDLHMAPSTLYK